MTDIQPTYYTAIAGDAKWDSLDLSGKTGAVKQIKSLLHKR